MLKKKILGAKVLDTNGYVLATRLVTPAKPGGKHLLGDIYNANAIDELIKSGGSSSSDSDMLSKIDELSKSVEEASKQVSNVYGMSLSGSYNPDSNKLNIVITFKDGTKASTLIDMANNLDSNDLVQSESTTVSYENGKAKTNVNTMTDTDVNDTINSILK